MLKDIYKGFSNLYPRSTGLMTYYFCVVDTFRRKTNIFNYKVG